MAVTLRVMVMCGCFHVVVVQGLCLGERKSTKVLKNSTIVTVREKHTVYLFYKYNRTAEK